MTSLPTDEPGLTTLDRWLESSGAVRATATNEFELRRWHTALGHLILYRNAKNDRRWVAAKGSNQLVAIALAYRKGKVLTLGIVEKQARKAKSRPVKDRMMGALLTRQDNACFYCGCLLSRGVDNGLGSAALASFEHIVPLNKGGPDTLDNMVAACEPCNRDAGSLSVYEKVLLREERFPHG